MLTRRTAIATLLAFLIPGVVFGQQRKLKSYIARIRTKGKSIVGTTVQARDLFEAQNKVQKRYPGCTILSLQEKSQRR